MEKNQNLNSKNNIEYSTKIFDKMNEERPAFILKDLEEINDKGDVNRILAILLKYKINDKEQEVIIGTLQNTLDRTDKARIIIQYLADQFRENFEGDQGFDSFDKLNRYLKKERVPFKLTLEGTSIISAKDKDDIQVMRTVSDNENGKLNKFFMDEDIEQMKNQQNIELVKHIREEKQEKKWNERRKKILKQLEKTSKDEKDKFINGEKITDFINSANEDNDMKKELVGDYLVECFESGEPNKINLAEGYAQMQEKGFAINVRVALEEQRDKCYNLIQTEESKQTVDKVKIGKITKLIDDINEYLNLFELIKGKRDWNASFTYKAKKLNFAEVKKLCELYKPEDKEILQYLDFKEKTLNDEKLNKSGKENEYSDSESIQNLDNFLVKSCVQDYTNPNTLYSAKNVVIENGKYMVEKLYEHIARELINYNSDNLELFNEYAKKSDGIRIYPVDTEIHENGEKKEISNTVKKLSEKIIEGDRTYPDFDSDGNR